MAPSVAVLFGNISSVGDHRITLLSRATVRGPFGVVASTGSVGTAGSQSRATVRGSFGGSVLVSSKMEVFLVVGNCSRVGGPTLHPWGAEGVGDHRIALLCRATVRGSFGGSALWQHQQWDHRITLLSRATVRGSFGVVASTNITGSVGTAGSHSKATVRGSFGGSVLVSSKMEVFLVVGNCGRVGGPSLHPWGAEGGPCACDGNCGRNCNNVVADVVRDEGMLSRLSGTSYCISSPGDCVASGCTTRATRPGC